MHSTSKSSFPTKSCAGTFITSLAEIISWSVDAIKITDFSDVAWCNVEDNYGSFGEM